MYVRFRLKLVERSERRLLLSAIGDELIEAQQAPRHSESRDDDDFHLDAAFDAVRSMLQREMGGGDGGETGDSRARSRLRSALGQGHAAGLVGDTQMGAAGEAPLLPAHDEGVPNLVLLSSTAGSPDADLSLVMAAAMARMGVIQLKAVVSSALPARSRAMWVRNTLDCLDLADVPVGVSSIVETTEDRKEASAQAAEAMLSAQNSGRPPDADAADLLLQLYDEAEDHSVALVLTGTCIDLAAFVREHAPLFAAKTACVTMMGTVDEASLKGTGSEPIKPEPAGAKAEPLPWTYDDKERVAARFVFDKCQV